MSNDYRSTRSYSFTRSNAEIDGSSSSTSQHKKRRTDVSRRVEAYDRLRRIDVQDWSSKSSVYPNMSKILYPWDWRRDSREFVHDKTERGEVSRLYYKAARVAHKKRTEDTPPSWLEKNGSISRLVITEDGPQYVREISPAVINVKEYKQIKRELVSSRVNQILDTKPGTASTMPASTTTTIRTYRDNSHASESRRSSYTSKYSRDV